MNCDFKIGDHIKKAEEDQIFEIIDLKEVRGGNWHDGFSFTFIATIEPVAKSDNFEKSEPETDADAEECCVQYINYMCQINNIYATRVD